MKDGMKKVGSRSAGGIVPVLAPDDSLIKRYREQSCEVCEWNSISFGPHSQAAIGRPPTKIQRDSTRSFQ
jgi:hypothetical protein